MKTQNKIRLSFLIVFFITGFFQNVLGQEVPSLFPDNWAELSSEEEASIGITISNIFKEIDISDSIKTLKVRGSKLSSYSDVTLYEIKSILNEKQVLHYLISDSSYSHLIYGNSSAIHNINSANKLILNDIENVIEYVKLFTASMAVSDGYQILLISKPDEYDSLFHENYSISNIKSKIILPIVSINQYSEIIVIANTLIKDELLKITYRINSDNRVEMIQNEVIEKNLPVLVTKYENYGVVVEESPAYEIYESREK